MDRLDIIPIIVFSLFGSVMVLCICCIICHACKKERQKSRELEARIRLQEQHAKNLKSQQQNTMMQPVQSPQPSAPMLPPAPSPPLLLPHQYPYPPGTLPPMLYPEVSPYQYPYPPTQPSSTADQAPIGFYLPTRSPPVPVAPPYPYPPTGSQRASWIAPTQATTSTGWNSEALKPRPQPGILRMPSASRTSEQSVRGRGLVRVFMKPAVVHHASPATRSARSVRESSNSNSTSVSERSSRKK